MLWYSFVIGCVFVSGMDLRMMSLIVGLIGFSKLPIFRLHAWLPKIHVEASMVGSFFLARILLKLRIMFCSLYCFEFILVIIGISGAVVLMMIRVDGKVVIAYSSVVHMSLCGCVIGWMGMIVGVSHVIVSPIIFYMVYVGYVISGSRIMTGSLTRLVLGIVLTCNLRFPYLGSFMVEIYIVWALRRMLFLFFSLTFFLIRVVHMKIFFEMRRRTILNPLISLLVLIFMY